MVALAPLPKAQTRPFLGVERSVGGRAWRDRLDERATARALTIAQRHGTPELLARILAGRGVEADQVAAFLDPTVKSLMPDPHTLTAMAEAAERLADAAARGEKVAIFGDYDVDGVPSASSAHLLALISCSAAGSFDPIVYIPGPHLRGLQVPTSEADPLLLAERGAKASRPRSTAARPRSNLSPKRGGSASTSSSSIIIRPTRSCPTPSWSIRTGSTISPASAISPRLAWCS